MRIWNLAIDQVHSSFVRNNLAYTCEGLLDNFAQLVQHEGRSRLVLQKSGFQ